MGCLTETQYAQRRTQIALTHNVEEDFTNQWGLEAIRADRAWAQLELALGIGTKPGSGQTVGFLDSGIDEGHSLFDGTTIHEHLFSGATQETGDRRSHGTAVASVVVARSPSETYTNDVTAPRGVAWGADVAMFAVPTGSGSAGNYRPISLTALNLIDSSWAYQLTHIIDWTSGGRSLDFVNVSVGYTGIIEQYSEAELRANFDDSIAALAQTGDSDPTVFVVAAGNAHGDPCDPAKFTDVPDLCESYVDSGGDTNYRVNARSVDIDSGLQARISELRGHVIAVVAVSPDYDDDGDHEISSYSNRCGIAAQWCIAAPGTGMRAAFFGPYIDPVTNMLAAGGRGAFTSSGTSYAAPMVTGALVVMKHYFRDEISNTGLVSRLYATAYDQGIYADSAIYGHGLLDLAAALSPQGMPRVSLGTRVEEGGVALDLTRLSLGGALGDGLTQALAGQEIAAFDALGAPFWYALGSLANAAPGPRAGARLRRFMAQPETEQQGRSWRPVLGAMESVNGADRDAPLRLGVLEAPSMGADAGHLSFAGRAVTLRSAGQGGLDVAAFSTEGLDGLPPVTGATLAWRPDGSPLGVRGGWVGEREAMLGSAATGAFGRLAAGSAFVGIDGSAEVGAWRLGAGAEVGTVNGAGRGGLIADVSPLTTSAFGVRAERPLAGEGTLTLSLSQPLRVEAGRARFSVPVGRTKDGFVRRNAVSADLAPTGREIEAAAQWRKTLSAGGEVRLGIAWTRHPGHAAGADPDFTLLAGWRHAF